MLMKHTLAASAAPDHPFGNTLGVALGWMLKGLASLRAVVVGGGTRHRLHGEHWPAAASALSGEWPASRDADNRLRDRLLARLARHEGWQGATANLIVRDGLVTCQGHFARESARRATLRVIGGMPGVQSVQDDRVRAREWQSLA